jgi:hypothetical protein
MRRLADLTISQENTIKTANRAEIIDLLRQSTQRHFLKLQRIRSRESRQIPHKTAPRVISPN